jgi:hypothetical protein
LKNLFVGRVQLSQPIEDDDGDDETTDFAQQCHLSELNSAQRHLIQAPLN